MPVISSIKSRLGCALAVVPLGVGAPSAQVFGACRATNGGYIGGA